MNQIHEFYLDIVETFQSHFRKIMAFKVKILGMFAETANLENYVIPCFQVSTNSFFYPNLKYLVPFLSNVKERGKPLAFQRVTVTVSSKACLVGYSRLFFNLPLAKWL